MSLFDIQTHTHTRVRTTRRRIYRRSKRKKKPIIFSLYFFSSSSLVRLFLPWAMLSTRAPPLDISILSSSPAPPTFLLLSLIFKTVDVPHAGTQYSTTTKKKKQQTSEQEGTRKALQRLFQEHFSGGKYVEGGGQREKWTQSYGAPGINLVETDKRVKFTDLFPLSFFLASNRIDHLLS